MEPLNLLLPQDVVTRDGFYTRNRHREVTLWDELAAKNPIHAAISVENDDQEEAKTERVLSLLESQLPDGAIVDLGCGYGRVAKYLLPKRVFKAYVGVDSSTTMLQLFQERYGSQAAEQTTPVLLVRSTLDDTLIEGESIDAVFSCAVLLHNSKRSCKAALQEAFRILKPGGKLVLVDSLPNMYSADGLMGTLYQGVYRLKGEGERNGPVRYFTEREIRKLLADFRDVTITRVGFVPLPTSFPFLPKHARAVYKRVAFHPAQRYLSRYVSRHVKDILCQYLDVVAHK